MDCILALHDGELMRKSPEYVGNNQYELFVMFHIILPMYPPVLYNNTHKLIDFHL